MGENLKLLFSIEDSAQALSVSKRTVYVLIGQGTLTTVKIGRRTLIKKDSLLKLAERGTDV